MTYASERRSNNRRKSQQKDLYQVQLLISEFVSFEQLNQADQNQNTALLFENLQKHIENHHYSIAFKKCLYQQLRKHIIRFNLKHDADVPLFTKQVITVHRDPVVFHQGWLQKSKYIKMVEQKLWRYWFTTPRFSDAEVVANILICATLYGGISKPASLEGLIEALKQGLNLYKLSSLELPIIFLQPISPSYGDIYHPKSPLRKSRHFIPDCLTLLWLARFHTQQMTVSQDYLSYLQLIFKKLELPSDQKQINLFLDAVPCAWQQHSDVILDVALSQSLAEVHDTCALSLTSFQHYLNPDLQPVTQLSLQQQKNVLQNKKSLINDHQRTDDYTEQLLQFHKHMLKSLREKQRHLDHLIHYMIANYENLPETAKRIGLWLISLFKTTPQQDQQLIECFDLDAVKWQKHNSYQPKLRISSIYTYFTKVSEHWLLYSSDFIQSEDLNLHLESIYRQMLSENKKSQAQKILLLRRFHLFQMHFFNAGPFPLTEDLKQAAYPRAEIISPKTFKHLLHNLPRFQQHPNYTTHDLEMLNIIYTLAYRTGMRINELLGLRIKDVEGVKCTSLWIRPYQAKAEKHLLKTDSAERNLYVKVLLNETELQQFQHYCNSRRASHQSHDYLFSQWNSQQRLTPHWVTRPFTQLLDIILPGHNYSFHTLRHTTANHLALILHMPYEYSNFFTDYTESHYQNIRQTLLRSSTSQDSWHLIAHLLGHISPDETFKSYLHLGYLLGGAKLHQHNPTLDRQMIQRICPHLVLSKTLQKSLALHTLKPAIFDLLQPIPLDNKPTNTLKAKSPRFPLTCINSQLHTIAGTPSSIYSSLLIAKVLKSLNQGYETSLLTQTTQIPETLIQQWQQNLRHLKLITNQKKVPRFIIDAQKSQRVIPHIESSEEKDLIRYFFKQLDQYSTHDAQLLSAIKIFKLKTNVSHAGLNFSTQDLKSAQRFMKVTYHLFPKNYWCISASSNLDQTHVLNTLKLSLSSVKYLTKNQLQNSVRLELISPKTGKSLAVFKYCFILLAILCETND